MILKEEKEHAVHGEAAFWMERIVSTKTLMLRVCSEMFEKQKGGQRGCNGVRGERSQW